MLKNSEILWNQTLKVIQARNIVPPTSDPPDTYVKCYVKDGERLRHKKKTRVVRNSFEPIYKQTLKYSVSCFIVFVFHFHIEHI